MFESSLVPRKRSRRWGWTLAAAVTLHGVAATAVVLASVWNVPQVEPPELVETVYVTLPPPLGDDAPAKENPAPPQPPRANVAPPLQQPRQSPAAEQPREVPQSAPAPGAEPLPETPTTGSDQPPGGGGNAGPGVPWGTRQGTGDDDTPIELGANMTRPEVIERVTPQYTESARRARVEGTVIVRATIDRQGRVTDVRVLKPLGMGLDQSATAAVQQWRFRPATLDGRPVPVYFQLSVTFNVR